jgi:hypothetical protein
VPERRPRPRPVPRRGQVRPLGTNLVEGLENALKVIKRIAYGFRDDACPFLKIRAAFPRDCVKSKKRSAVR